MHKLCAQSPAHAVHLAIVVVECPCASVYA
jgi:hypothetical protein